MKNSKKKTMRFYLTLAGIKVLIKVLQLCGRNATHVPGRKAINICPDFLDQIDKPEFIIGITGTNGKTTVSNLIADVMRIMDMILSTIVSAAILIQVSLLR